MVILLIKIAVVSSIYLMVVWLYPIQQR